MTSKIVVNNIEADTGVSTVTFASAISAPTFVGNLSGSVNLTTGITTVAVGSTSAPSITPTGDSNTGIFFPSADTVCVGTGGSEVFRVNSGFNVGINSTSPQTKLDVVGGIKGVIVQGTSQVSTAGTSIDFTGIPSWAKRITIMLQNVSTTGSSQVLIRVGTASGIVASAGSYLGSSDDMGSAVSPNNFSTGFSFEDATMSAAAIRHGTGTLCNISGNNWVFSFLGARSDTTTLMFGAGSISAASLGGTLDRIRLTTSGGSDTFDLGSVNIFWEG